MKEYAMKSPITRIVLIASLALAGNPAMAANITAHHTTRVVAHARPAVHAVPRTQLNADIGQFIQSMLGGGPVAYSRLVQDAMRARPSSRSQGSSQGSYDWSSPSYDSSPTIDESSAAQQSQAASDAENQAIQSMNDTNAMNASMAAAEQQNDAANAAALQTEINAGN
jgi:hypothetical protein